MADKSPAQRTRLWSALVLALSLLATYAAPAQADPSGQVQRESIRISSDQQFNPANGVRSGSGTARDPYVISGWDLPRIDIRDTSAHVLITNNTVDQLILNWNGPGVTVIDNVVGDLRVNQNIKRTGAATGGLIANNRFGIVGQLRHFDGVFENNVVRGNPSAFGTVFSNKSVQFDGFHGSKFRNNTINGWVEVRLHGHHHGSSFDADSHHHGQSAGHEGHDMPEVDHTKRFHEVWVTNNEITATGPHALLYTDTAHVANDRTAASEENPRLNDPHIHSTRVHLENNRLVGAGIMVDVFNADDQRHTGTNTGLVNIRNNEITLTREMRDNVLWGWKDGIRIQRAKDARVEIANNTVVGEPRSDRDVLDERFSNFDGGIVLQDVDLANIYLTANSVTDMTFGIRATRMTKNVHWWISDLRTRGVQQSVYYDNSVANQPRQRS
ncbi:MAG: hypothetical protein ACLGIB_03270 [Actinomycetota bacterium]